MKSSTSALAALATRVERLASSPVHPCQFWAEGHNGGHYPTEQQEGLTFRQYVAALCLQGLAQSGRYSNPGEAAASALGLAAALLGRLAAEGQTQPQAASDVTSSGNTDCLDLDALDAALEEDSQC